jgi:hypothetical protein
VSIEPCDRCGKLDGVKWRRCWMWQCLACLKKTVPPIPCSKCGADAHVAGIERFMKLGAGYDSYDLQQALGFRCSAGHVTIDRRQWGPGSKKGGEAIA